MKLDELLGADLYAQVKAKLDEKNSNEPDKLKHVRYADLSEGEYVGKAKYDSEIEKMNGIISSKDAELVNANALIAELKKASKGNEEIQQKVAEYEKTNAQLQAELATTKIKAAIKVGLLADHCTDVDYLTFKLNEKLNSEGRKLELDENDSIKDWKTYSEGLKVQFPHMYEAGSQKKIDEHKLQGSDGERTMDPKSLAEALQQQFENK